MGIDRKEVLKIAELANLEFSEGEIDSFTEQFQHILEYIEKLREVDVDEVEPTSHVSPAGNLGKHQARDDEVRRSLSVEESLGGAPDRGDDYFKVPKVI